jgi:hypothetical protein
MNEQPQLLPAGEPTNRELMIHLLYLREGMDRLNKGQQLIEQDVANAQGDIRVLQERTPRQASGWGSIAGMIGGFLGGIVQGMFRQS